MVQRSKVSHRLAATVRERFEIRSLTVAAKPDGTVCYNVRMTAPRTFTFLGTGTSVGVPMVGCDCPVCRSTNPRNQRYRCSVLIRLPAGNLLIDTPPEIRLQLLRARVPLVHAVLYTHYHADHLFGLDDLRPIPKYLGGPVPLYCSADTERVIRQAFSYAFREDGSPGPMGYVPQLSMNRISDEPFTVLGQRVVPIPLEHAHFDVYGFRIDDVAYCTDVNRIPNESWPRLEGLRVLVLDCLRFKAHVAHFGLNEALDVIDRVKPQRAYLTHMSHELEHEATNRLLPPHVELAYDGLEFPF
jgi:phosphoribosyl 1,2-cyclic phosphate phosphodiesterase